MGTWNLSDRTSLTYIFYTVWVRRKLPAEKLSKMVHLTHILAWKLWVVGWWPMWLLCHPSSNWTWTLIWDCFGSGFRSMGTGLWTRACQQGLVLDQVCFTTGLAQPAVGLAQLAVELAQLAVELAQPAMELSQLDIKALQVLGFGWPSPLYAWPSWLYGGVVTHVILVSSPVPIGFGLRTCLGLGLGFGQWGLDFGLGLYKNYFYTSICFGDNFLLTLWNSKKNKIFIKV